MSKTVTRLPAAKARSILSLAALLAFVAALSLFTFNNTNAQTTTASALAVPELTAQATAQGVELNWKTVPDAVRYEFLTWWDTEIGWQPIGGNNLTGASYTHTDVTAGATYFYSIRAVDAAGEAGAWLERDYPTAIALATDSASPTTTPTTSPTLTPAATGPATSTPTPTATASALAAPQLTASATVTGVLLTWEAVPNAVRYELLTYYDAAIGWQQIGGNNLTGTSFTHTDVTAGTHYFYSIRAVDAAGQPGAWLQDDYPSATALTTQRVETPTPTTTQAAAGTATPTPTTTQTAAGTSTSTPTTTPAPTASALSPPTLSVQATGHGVVLTWPAVPGAVRYELLTWWNQDIGWHPIGGSNLTGASYTHTSVSPGRKYHYTIRALNAAGAASNWLSNYPSVTAIARQVSPPSRSTPPSAPLPQVAGLSAPTLTAKRTGTNAIELSWTPVPGAARYILGVWWSGNEGWSLRSGGTDLNGTSAFHGGFAAGKTFYFIVAGLDGSDDWGPFSEYASITIPVFDRAGSAERAALVALYHATDGANWKSNDNWLTDEPVATWYGVFTDSNGHVNRLDLEDNGLRGAIPDLGALSNLWEVNLSRNQLTGPIPHLGNLTDLTKLNLIFNQLSGPIPDLSSLTDLRVLDLEGNQLSGPIPALSALTKLTLLSLGSNRLSGRIPDLSALTRLNGMALYSNQLTGPILNLNHLTNLTSLILRENQLSGPIPNLSALTRLHSVDLSSNPLCLPPGSDFSDVNEYAAVHLESLNLPACTSSETMLTPAVPQNLTATVSAGQVTLTWRAAANAANYELRAWDSVSRRWDTIGRALTATTFTHSVVTDERHYEFQVRALNANRVHSAWSESLSVAVVPQHFPPPPQSLNVNPIYQKHVNVGGVHVVADSNVSDAQMVQSRQIVSGMLSSRPDLHTTLSANRTTIFLNSTHRGNAVAHKGPGPWTILMNSQDPYCRVFIHEFAHQVHFALEEQPRGHEFNTRLDALYRAAVNAGRWSEMYAQRNSYEYWAETVTYWFWQSLSDPLESACRFGGSTCFPLEHTYSNLADYDPEIAKLIAEVFGEDATVPPACKP